MGLKITKTFYQTKRVLCEFSGPSAALCVCGFDCTVKDWISKKQDWFTGLLNVVPFS